MTDEYKRLPDVVEVSGAGIPQLTAKLIERTENKALYYRWDNVYEVFRVKKSGATEMMGREYPRREVYPGSGDFGKTAWCFSDEKMARLRYKLCPDVPVYIGQREGDNDLDE
jgi:hypothetical protein